MAYYDSWSKVNLNTFLIAKGHFAVLSERYVPSGDPVIYAQGSSKNKRN